MMHCQGMAHGSRRTQQSFGDVHVGQEQEACLGGTCGSIKPGSSVNCSWLINILPADPADEQAMLGPHYAR